MSEPGKDEADGAIDALIEASYCNTIEDFRTPAARDVMGRYLSTFLYQLVITPNELIHSAKHMKRLSDAGRVLMNVVDKVGTLQARRKNENPGKRIKDLHELVSKLTRKLWDEDKEKPVPTVKPEAFNDAVARLPKADRDYGAHRLLAEYLSQFKVWKDKIKALVKLMELCRGKDTFAMIEAQLGETLKSDPALDQLLGMPECLEPRCKDLIELWKGSWQQRDTADATVETLNGLIASGEAPSLKAAMEFALLRALAGKTVLRSADPEREITAVYDLFRSLWLGQNLLGGAKTLAMLEKRQSRVITKEAITDLLRERKVVADRLLYLMQISGLAVGGGNRATLKVFIDHYFADRDFVPRIVAGQEPPVPKMQTLTQLHRLLKGSWLPDGDKAGHMALVEAAQTDLIRRSRLLEQIEKKGGGPSQKVLTLLDLHRKGTFLEGRNTETVREVVESYMRDPQFLTEYLGGSDGDERARKVQLLSRTLATIGITWAS
jgi:hypothetical protein